MSRKNIDRFQRNSQKDKDNLMLANLRGDRSQKSKMDVRSMQKSKEAQKFAEGLDGYKTAMHANPETLLELITNLQEEAAKAEVAKIDTAEKVFQDAMNIAQEAIKEGVTPEEILAADTYVEETNSKERKLSAKLVNLLQRVESPFKPKRRTIIMRRAIATIMTLMLFVAACVPSNAETPSPEIEPVVTQPADLPPTDPAPATETAIAPPTEIPSFNPNQLSVSSNLENQKTEIIERVRRDWENIFKASGIVSSVGYEVVAFADNGYLIKPNSGYPEGTHFAISNVPRHEGEVITVSYDGAQAKTGIIINEIKLGVNGLPVGLYNGQVVVYVNAEGQWTAGYMEVAGEKVDIAYFDMTTEEQLLQSQSDVEKASTYNGDVSFIPVLLDGLAHPEYLSYWNPTAQAQHGLTGTGSWASAHNTPPEKLDKKGDSFPPIAIQGRENPDGSLVMIDPDTGAEITFDKVYVPGFGEVTLKELYAMDKSTFGTQLAESLLENSNFDDHPDHLIPNLIRSAPTDNQSVYILGFKYGEQNHFYANLSGGGSSGINELPDEGYIYYEHPTNSFAMPIESPETGRLMLWLNIQEGNMTKNITIQYSENPENNSSFIDSVGNRTYQSFGSAGQPDEFGILIATKNAQKAHNTGGGYPLLPGGEGIGGAAEIEAILNATTEQEILDIISQYRIFISNPTMIAFPER